MSRKLVFALVLLIAVLVGASYFSPHWTIYRMQRAIEARNYDAFSSHVDYPALRNSFKEQFIEAGRAPKTPDDGNADALGALGRGIVDTLAGPMLSAVVTPAGLIEMMNAGKPEITQAVIASSITRVPTAAQSLPDMKVTYEGRNRVLFHRVDAPAQAGSFVLLRDGWWSWKLSAVELPK